MANKEKAAKSQEGIMRTIEFEWNGTTYTMEFNRTTAGLLEQRYGINVAELVSGSSMRVTELPTIFMVSLMMHHPNMKASTATQLYDMMDDKQALMLALIEMLGATVMDVFEEPEEGKAISWTRR